MTGLGLGVLLPLGTTYINELAPQRVSNKFSLWGVTLGWSLGGVFAGLVGVFLTPHYGWQILYYVGALSIPLTFVVHAVLPESPKFLAAHGRFDELRALLTQAAAGARPKSIKALRSVSPPQAAGWNTIGALLTPRYRRVSLTIWGTAFLTLFAIFGLTGWIPTVMIKRGETFAASFGFGALMQATSFIGGLTLATLGRPQLCPYAALSRDVVGSRRARGAVAGVHQRSRLQLAIVAVAGFCIIGAQHVLNNFTAGSYDTGFRASGVGMELGVGRVGAILGPYVIGLLQQATGGPDAVFWAIGGAAIVGGLRDRIARLAALRRRPAAVDTAPSRVTIDTKGNNDVHRQISRNAGQHDGHKRLVLLFARLAIAPLFLYSGIGKVMAFSATAAASPAARMASDRFSRRARS